jgi:hypothetical protein
LEPSWVGQWNGQSRSVPYWDFWESGGDYLAEGVDWTLLWEPAQQSKIGRNPSLRLHLSRKIDLMSPIPEK